VAIVHLQRQHDVAVWAPRGDRVALFDSSRGVRRRRSIEDVWTGKARVVRHEPPA
jgi:hypothetical protein